MFSAGRPTMLSEGEYLASVFPLTGVTYDVTRDGQRFLMIRDAQQASATQINVVVNGFDNAQAEVCALQLVRLKPDTTYACYS